MKRKILLGFLLVLTLITFTGCGAKLSNNTTEKNEIPKNGIKFEDEYFVFDQSETNNEMHFKLPNEFSIGGYNSMTGITYSGSKSEIKIQLNYFENQSLQEGLSTLLNNQYEELEVNNIKWYHGVVNIQDGTVNSVYLTEYNNKIYIYMINKEDVTKDIEEAFLNGITF